MRTFLRATLAVAALIVFSTAAARADQTKANNSTALNVGGSWVSGVVPGATDVAVFDTGLTLSTFANGTTPAPLGGDLSLAGIRVAGPVIGNANNQNGIVIGNVNSANTLTLGSAGIDLGAANAAPLNIQSKILIGADQTWNLSDASAQITSPAPATPPAGQANGNRYSAFALSQDEDLAFSAQAANAAFDLGTHAVTKTGVGTLAIHGGYLLSNGTLNISDGTVLIQGGSSRTTTVNNDVTVNVNGSTSILRFQSNSGAVASNGTINLNNGGTLWLTTNNATLGTTITGAIHVAGSGIILAGRNPLTGNNSAAPISVSANITGDAASTLSLRNEYTNTSSVYSFSGDNSGFAGTAVLDSSTGQSYARLTSNTAGSAAAKWVVNGNNTLQVAGNISVQLGSLSGDGTVSNPTAATNATINVGSGSFNGSLTNGTGTLTLNKITAGTLTLSGSTQNATVNLTAGKIVAGSGSGLGDGNNTFNQSAGTTVDLNGQSPSIGSLAGAGGVITNGVATPVTLNLGNTPSSTYGGVIQNGAGTVAISKIGNGTLTLTGANTYTGNTEINVGGVVVNGSLASTGTVNVNNSAILSGTGSVGSVNALSGASIRAGALAADGTVGTLTMAALNVDSADLRLDLIAPANADKLTVTGTANFTGSSTITPTTAPQSGTYTLLTAGSLTGTAPTLNTPAAGTTRSTYSLNFDTTNKRIQLVVTGNPKSLTWTGAASAAWDVNLTQNWSDNGGATTNEKFFNLDSVTFTNGPTNRNVTLDTQVTPGSITVNNSAGNDYTISGGGGFADSGLLGGTALTKSGAGTLTLGTVNTYAGRTAIQGGTLKLGAFGALPSGTALVLGDAANSGTLDLNGVDATVTGLATSGTGTANVIGNGATNSPSMLTVNGTGTTTFAGRIVDTLGTGTQKVALTVNGGTLTLSGLNSYSGGTTVNAATLVVGSGSALGATTGNLTLSNAATVDLAGNGVSVGALSGDSGTTITSSVPGAITLAAGANDDATYAGVINNGSGTVSVVKAGPGTLTLSGANSTFSGGLTLNNGAVRAAAVGSLGTGTTTVNTGGTLVVSAAITSPITIGNGTIGSSGSPAQFTNKDFTVTTGSTATLYIADPQNTGVNSEMILSGTLRGGGNINVLAGSNNPTPDSGVGFRLRGTAASDYTGVITLGPSVKGELQTTVAGPFSPAGAGKIVMTAGTSTGTLQGTYTELNLRNNTGATGGNTTFGNDIEITGAGYAIINAIGSAPAGAISTMGNLKIGANQILGVDKNGTPSYTAAFTSVTLTGGNATFSPNTPNAGYSGSADLNLGPIAEAAPGAGIVMDGQATLLLTGANTFTGPTLANRGTLRVTGSLATSSGVTVASGATYDVAASQSVKTLTVNDGGITTVSAGGLKVGANNSAAPLTLTGTAKIDLKSGGLAVDHAAGSENANLKLVRDAILAGHTAAGDWSGNGITSSVVAGTNKGVGYAPAAEVLPFANGATTDTFLGQTVDKSTVLARTTLLGDATLDGNVDFNDLVKLAQNYNTTVSATTDSWWAHGDFTYDGVTDFNDLVKLAQNYNTSLPAAAAIPGASAAFDADLARAAASVPEPGTFAVLGVGVLFAVRRRRSR